eukprot:UN15886
MSRYDGFKGGIIMKNEEESLKEPLLTSTFVFENTAKMNKWIHSKDRREKIKELDLLLGDENT